MAAIKLVHWKVSEATERASQLEAMGHAVELGPEQGVNFLRQLTQDAPAAIVIDLTRLPSQGRDLALTIRKRKSTRHIPLVFVGGAAEKVARVRELLPDAVFTTWDRIAEDLPSAIAEPPHDPVVPDSHFVAYAGRPLCAKLGIKEGGVVDLISAPPGFESALEDLPAGAQVRQGAGEEFDLTIWFVRASEDLNGLERMVPRAGAAPLWIAWPKRSSGIETDLTQQRVRDAGLAAGLVDYKICSIDETWSGLLFTRRDGGDE